MWCCPLQARRSDLSVGSPLLAAIARGYFRWVLFGPADPGLVFRLSAPGPTRIVASLPVSPPLQTRFDFSPHFFRPDSDSRVFWLAFGPTRIFPFLPVSPPLQTRLSIFLLSSAEESAPTPAFC